MDMIYRGRISGVMRFMDIIYMNAEKSEDITPHLIRITSGGNALIFHRLTPNQFIIENDGRLKIEDEHEFIFKNIERMFWGKSNIVLYVNTLDLIGLAVYIRERTGAKIVTTLHCIPWHTLYNVNKKKFRELYGRETCDSHCVGQFETQSYTASDAIITVAASGKRHVKSLTGRDAILIENGLPDYFNSEKQCKEKDEYTCIIVGGEAPMKGLDYALKAINKANKSGARVKCISAGKASETFKDKARTAYPDTEITFINVSLQELCEFYKLADFGILPSLSEQCSYAAIEMMMFGLPLIASDIEAFRDMGMRDCAMFVPVLNDNNGLHPDINQMADCVATMVADIDLRRRLSANARARYLAAYTEKESIKKTFDVFRAVLGI